MKRILVGLDDSEQSLHALTYARNLATATGGKLILAFACEPLRYLAEPQWVPFAEIERAQREHGQEVVKRAHDALKGFTGEVDETLLFGPAAEALVDAAEKKDADLIVVGSHGRGAVKRLLLGSVADRTVHLSKRPVLIVH